MLDLDKLQAILEEALEQQPPPNLYRHGTMMPSCVYMGGGERNIPEEGILSDNFCLLPDQKTD